MPTAAEKRRVVGWVRKWQRRMLLDTWTGEVGFCDAPPQDDTDTLAHIDVRYRYNSFSITIYPLFWSAPDQELTIVHELGHCITEHQDALVRRRLDRMRVTASEATDVNEKATEHIAKMMWRAYQ